jgi:hypothetical protein
VRLAIWPSLTVHFAVKELNLGNWCGIMLELWLKLAVLKVKYFIHICNNNNGNTKYSVFISNSDLKKPSKLSVFCLIKVQKLNHYSFLMLGINNVLYKAPTPSIPRPLFLSADSHTQPYADKVEV